MIYVAEYFRKPHSWEQEERAGGLLANVEALRQEAEREGVARSLDPDTGCEISGSKGGDGDGGFRTPGSDTGVPGSAHRSGEAVDVYDPENKLDTWLDTFETGDGGNTKLSVYGLFREAPDSTPGWCHLQTRAPGSGKRTFQP